MYSAPWLNMNTEQTWTRKQTSVWATRDDNRGLHYSLIQEHNQCVFHSVRKRMTNPETAPTHLALTLSAARDSTHTHTHTQLLEMSWKCQCLRL